jgi:hypothetical protein
MGRFDGKRVRGQELSSTLGDGSGRKLPVGAVTVRNDDRLDEYLSAVGAEQKFVEASWLPCPVGSPWLLPDW